MVTLDGNCCYFTDGDLNGICCYFTDGDLNGICCYLTDGDLNGICCYFTDGDLNDICCYFTDGDLNGNCCYFTDGDLKYICCYFTDGDLNGNCSTSEPVCSLLSSSCDISKGRCECHSGYVQHERTCAEGTFKIQPDISILCVHDFCNMLINIVYFYWHIEQYRILLLFQN